MVSDLILVIAVRRADNSFVRGINMYQVSTLRGY